MTDSSAHAARAAAAPASAACPAALEPGEPLDDEEVVVALFGVADARWPASFDATSAKRRGFGKTPALGNCAASAESSAAHARARPPRRRRGHASSATPRVRGGDVRLGNPPCNQ